MEVGAAFFGWLTASGPAAWVLSILATPGVAFGLASTVLAALLAALLGAVLGAKLGNRYHRKIDAAGFDNVDQDF